MKTNKKGFSLIELTAVILVIGVLTSIAIPYYKTSTMKTRIVVNMPLLRALQNDMINFYNLNNTLPSRMTQLAINKGEFSSGTTRVTHIPTNCTFTLSRSDNSASITETCNNSWKLIYSINKTAIGYAPAIPVFEITGDVARNRKIANELNWREISSNKFEVI